MDLTDAQQARRVLDRIVGYKISPVLWKKVQKGLSAGRVQSVAVRLIVEREEEIENFKPEEYWNIYAKLKEPKTKKSFQAKLYGKVYNVIPINNTIIVQCPQGDLQDSFVKVFNIPLNVFNDELNNVFKELQISADEFYNDPINILKSISVTDLDIDYFFYDKLINQIEKNKSMDNAFNIFNYYMSPTLNKFNLIKYGQKLATNKECWFSGPALLITPSEFEKIKKEL
jgi:hypothetical protein